MKKMIFVIFLCFVSLTFISCSSSKKELQTEIELVNNECPMSLGMVGTLSSFKYDNNSDEVVMTMTISKDIPLKLSALNQLKNTLKKSVLGVFAKSESCTMLMQKIANAKAKFTVVMKVEDINESIKINISKEEVLDLAEGKVDPITPRDMLEIMVASTNAQCPLQIDEMTVLSSVAIEGSNFVYNYSIDENSVSIEALEANKAALKANVKQMLSSLDPMVKEIVKVCKEANVNILYRYIGDTSGSVCVVKFTPLEL